MKKFMFKPYRKIVIEVGQFDSHLSEVSYLKQPHITLFVVMLDGVHQRHYNVTPERIFRVLKCSSLADEVNVH